jgi:hypothetical protein
LARRVDGRLILVAMLAVGSLAVGLNLLFRGGGPARVIDRPSSVQASPGVTYPATLESRCPLVVDFDGSFWVASSGDPSLRPDDHPVTVALRSEKRALLETPRLSIPLRRRDGPLLVPPCPS